MESKVNFESIVDTIDDYEQCQITGKKLRLEKKEKQAALLLAGVHVYRDVPLDYKSNEYKCKDREQVRRRVRILEEPC